MRRLNFLAVFLSVTTGYGVGAAAGETPQRFEAWAMRVHGLAAFGGLLMLGVLAASHVPHGWRMSGRHGWRRQRGLGASLCELGAALALTGYVFYYFAPETMRPVLGWVHALAGVVMVILVAVHRRRRHGQES